MTLHGATGHHAASGVRRGRRAVSFVEALVSMVIMVTAMGAGIATYSAYARGQVVDSETAVSAELAGALMAEIFSKAFEDPESGSGSFGIETGESGRSLYDDVDDYDGLSESPPKAPDESALASYTGYSQQVVVSNVDDTTLAQLQADGSTRSKRIAVSVTCGGKVRAELTAYRIQQDGL